MIFSNSIIVVIVNLIVIKSTASKYIKDLIGFPEMEENPKLVNKQNRTPVFIPSMCPENELLYPGDQDDDWICDCRPGYIYHPNTDACWLAYRRGPCPPKQYLVLQSNSVQPTCINNPCMDDMRVLWKGKCEPLGSSTACGLDNFPVKSLWVNATTLNIECVPVHIDYRFNEESEVRPIVNCALGCKRHFQGTCTPDIDF